MRERLGISDEVWTELRQPRPLTVSDLDHHTALYADVYIALRVFGIRYPQYVQQTTPSERLLYQFFLALEAAKEQRAMERQQQEMDMERQARAATIPPQYRQ
jgi:hypothetical protein